MPDTPTFAEAGLSNIAGSVWVGVLAPANTPPDIVQKLNREIVAILREPAMRARVTEQGFLLVAGSAEEFGQTIKADHERFGVIVRNAGIKID